MMILIILADVTMPPAVVAMDLCDAVFEAFRAIETRMRTYTEPEDFDRMLSDARNKFTDLREKGGAEKCLSHLSRALQAYDIVNEIWQAQEHDSTVDAGWTCVPLDRYELWLKTFPALLTWRWGIDGIGVSDVHEAYFEPFQCCIILKPFLDDIWAPCLFHQAHLEIGLAEACFNREH